MFLRNISNYETEISLAFQIKKSDADVFEKNIEIKYQP